MIYAEYQEIPLVVENKFVARLILVIDITGPKAKKLKYLAVLPADETSASKKTRDHFPATFRSRPSPSLLVEIHSSVSDDQVAYFTSQVSQTGFIGITRDDAGQ